MKKGNRPQIYITMCFFVLLFAALSVYIFSFVVKNEKVLISNNYNQRQQTLLTRNFRGTIYSRNGEALATSVLDENQVETRVYPYGSTFAHAIGYSTKGRMGIEAMANYWLLNSHISLPEKADNDRLGLKNPGNNVYSTLDVQLQQIADDYLGYYQGAAIVTEVKTGKILAMVSHPDFDPNEIDKRWDGFLKDEASSVLLNRATQGLYAPGSTFKMFTALEYFRQNPDTWQDFSFDCEGFVVFDDARINCIRTQSHGSDLSFIKCFAKSCNSSFATMGMSLNRKQFQDSLDGLMFNKDLKLDFPTSTSSLYISDKTPTDEMMQTSFGQGKTLITPMHLNMVTMAIANQGVLMKPYMIDRIENADGKILKQWESVEEATLLSEEEADFMTEIMTAVVQEGTAKRIKDLPYHVAGKTGSAEYNDAGDSHAWFTSFAPAEDPEIAITIIVESAGTGTEYAIPLAKRLYDAYFS